MHPLPVAVGTLILAALPLFAEAYPAAEGFNADASDARAIAVADATMEAMGGYAAWDQTRYITWRFFGGRLHVWDKWTGNVRFEQDDLTVLMNLHTRSGRAWREGRALADAELQAALDRGYRSWINDAYWFVMPYKLKDSGVTLNYVGTADSQDGRPADVLELTFEGVGVTPQNKYRVWVDQETHLVSQWAFYPQASDSVARFIGPWNNWRRYGQILLSDNRGERSHTGVAVFADLPAAVFDDPQPLGDEVLSPVK